MNLLYHKRFLRGYRAIASIMGAIIVCILVGSRLDAPVQAKVLHADQEAPSAVADLTARQQVTDTTDMTDTVDMTDTATDATTTTDTTTATDTTDTDMVTGGDSPENALVPPSEETTLAPGERRWYIFQYSYDGEGDPSDAIVELRMAQPGSLSFEVWSQDDVNRWRNGEDFTPTGAGTPAFAIEEDEDAGDRDRSLLRWVGNAEASVRFYLVVRNSSDSLASFNLNVSGPDVSFLTPASAASGTESGTTDVTDTAAMTDTTGMTDTSGMTSEADMVISGGTGPDDAVSPIGQRETLAPGERRWYIFQYSYDGEGEPSNAIVELRMAQPGSVSFEVWSQDDVESWRNGEDFTPTGAGTPAFAIEEGDDADDRDPTLLRWVGNAEASVRFYVILRNSTDNTATYRLTVSGPDVSFLAPALGDTTAMTDTAGMTETTDMADTTAMTDTIDTTMSGGTGPEDALPITGQRATLGPNEHRWYTFEYAYDGNGDPSNAIVELRMAQSGSLGFEVWSGDDVESWQNNEDFSPTGAGTPAFAIAEDDADDRDRSLLRWVGNADTIARFYVIVDNNTDTFVSYRLTASGPDVRN